MFAVMALTLVIKLQGSIFFVRFGEEATHSAQPSTTTDLIVSQIVFDFFEVSFVCDI